MNFFPVLVKTNGHRVIVSGGGEQAAWKVHSLLQAGVRVHIVSNTPHPSCKVWQEHPLVKISRRTIEPIDLRAGSLIFIADEVRAQAQEIKGWAEQTGAWINVVDKPEWCDFYSMAQIHRGDLVVAIATSGKAPGLAHELKNFLEEVLGNEWALKVDQAAAQRSTHSSRSPKA